jgi:hypothetical protein
LQPPSGTQWSDLWHVDSSGWMYAINFTPSDVDNGWFHHDQRSSDFVRRRRWIRTATKVAYNS